MTEPAITQPASSDSSKPDTDEQVRLSFARLRSRIDALAAIGVTPDGSCARLALTDEDRAGRDLVVTWMNELGLRVDIDAVGNVVGTWPADRFDPPVMTGSHIDTVATGGRYDGCLGVLAGLEVIETVITSGIETDHPLAVAFFTDEEGSRFAPDMLGSLVFVGGFPVEAAHHVVGVDGAMVGEELRRIGYLGTAPSPALPPRAFVELHIEQGPVLEGEGITIGAVTGVQGISWTKVVIGGQSNHAGTTPMHMRHDAAYVAAELTVWARRITEELGPPLVATVGRVEVHPDLVNVVAARATITVDLRHTDDSVLDSVEEGLRVRCDELESLEGVTISTTRLARFAPVEFAEEIVELVERTAATLDMSVRRLPSGAGHDAQMLARVCPAGMVFVPSAGGISHNPAEHTHDDDLAAGARVLLHMLFVLAGAHEPTTAPTPELS